MDEFKSTQLRNWLKERVRGIGRERDREQCCVQKMWLGGAN